MNLDPLSIALQEITETRRLLETLITSSESFDYPKAKIALRQLNRKVRDLRKHEVVLQDQLQSLYPNVHILDFCNGTGQTPARAVPPSP
jgi:hypothetical protein